MNKLYTIGALAIILILIAVVWLGGQRETGPTEGEQQITSAVQSYSSQTGAVIYIEKRSDRTAVVRGGEYDGLIVTQVETSAGERYISADGLVDVWLRDDTIAISASSAVVYTGTYFDSSELGEPVTEPTPIPSTPAPTTPTPQPDPSPTPNLTDLSNKTWYWVSTEVGASLTTPKNPSRFTMEFKADGTLSGSTDCNNYGGHYEISGDTITFGVFFQTKMACLDSQEIEFLQHFIGTMNLSRGDTELKFTKPANNTVIRLSSQRPIARACYVGGCSSQVCSENPDILTTCEFRPEYACYQGATCERQISGECSWTETPALTKCLAEGLTS